MESKKRRIENKRRRMRTLRKIRAAFLLILILIGLYLFFTKAPLFSVKNFSVEGNTEVTDNDVVNKSGVLKGQNIFKIDKEQAQKNLKSQPYIESSEVSRVLPDTVKIKIKEKKDIYIINYGDEAVYVGKNAQPLMIANKEDMKETDIPILEGLHIENPEILKTLKYTNEDIEDKEFRDFTNGLLKWNISSAVSKIEITEDSQVILKTDDYQTIKLGKFRDMDYKMKLLSQILKDLKEKKVKFLTIDFTKSKRVVVQKMTEKDREELEKLAEEEKLEEERRKAEEGESQDENIEETENSEGGSGDGNSGSENQEQQEETQGNEGSNQTGEIDSSESGNSGDSEETESSQNSESESQQTDSQENDTN